MRRQCGICPAQRSRYADAIRSFNCASFRRDQREDEHYITRNNLYKAQIHGVDIIVLTKVPYFDYVACEFLDNILDLSDR